MFSLPYAFRQFDHVRIDDVDRDYYTRNVSIIVPASNVRNVTVRDGLCAIFAKRRYVYYVSGTKRINSRATNAAIRNVFAYDLGTNGIKAIRGNVHKHKHGYKFEITTE